MVLVSTTPHIVDAMETDIAPRTAHNSYENKIVNADIHIRSVRDEVGFSDTYVPGQALVEQSQSDTEISEEHLRAEQMRTWWNTAMKKHMDQPDGYEKVAVMLIKWADDLDELETKQETLELDALFRDRFHYETEIVELNVRKKAQHQLYRHVSAFVEHHDGPHSLLIFYYTGHGSWLEEKQVLELTASQNPDTCKGFYKDARASWNKIEARLKDDDIEGDILNILDTCYASNHVKSGKEDARKFETISACPYNQTTAAPGNNSFTRALIDSLTAMLNENNGQPLSTFRIVQRINLDKRRRDTASHVWDQGQKAENHIFLAPLGKPGSIQPKIRHTPGGYLTLRFGIRDGNLNEEQIEYMAMNLCKALNNKHLIGLKEVKWLVMEAGPPIPHFDRVALVIHVMKQWKKVIKKNKRDRESQRASQRPVDEVTLPDEMDLSPTISQKRSLEELEDLPEAKRQYLDPLHPPSPPISTSSRLE